MNDEIEKVVSNGNITIRPFQFEYKIAAYVERGGKIIDIVSAADTLMEDKFNGTNITEMVLRAKAALLIQYEKTGGK